MVNGVVSAISASRLRRHNAARCVNHRQHSRLKLHSHRIRCRDARCRTVCCVVFAAILPPVGHHKSFTWIHLHMTQEIVCILSSNVWSWRSQQIIQSVQLTFKSIDEIRERQVVQYLLHLQPVKFTRLPKTCYKHQCIYIKER